MAPVAPFRRLDKFSPQFPDQLTSLLHGQRYRDYVADLQAKDSSRLVEYLDDVLGTLQPTSLAFRTCLHELRTICGSWKILPQSHILPASLLSVAEQPIASRGSCDAYEGFFDNSKVCVKRLRVYSMEGPNDVKRAFCQEVVVWKRLAHPNIFPLLGVTIAPFQSISVWISGEELSQYISTHPCADRLDLLSDVANGLSYLHSHSVIHGDLKGPSILVDDTGRARLTDFGLAGIASDSGSAASITDGHAVRWAAPEVLDMERPVSKESDVYSFAMVVIEVFTGRAPFYNRAPTSVAVDVLSGNRPERPMHSSLTDDLWDLTEHCWNKDPYQRPGISEVLLRLPTTPTSRNGDHATLGETNLGSFRQMEPSSGSRYQPSQLKASSYKLQQLWKRSRSSISRLSPRRVPAYDTESEENGKTIDMRYKSSSSLNLLRSRDSWSLSYDNSSEKQEAVPTGDGVPSASTQTSLKQSLMQWPCFSSFRRV
ncbi:kinase-like protein [Thelephora ganbajun]|uniref:Kinase-like protein n=1 Tax=Thelephora ganbajun TaxID=370292 RepID=A0ACB6ZEC5_THEGA|nr:kinase-like protein [Thelephora ganbajun]